MVIDGTIGGPRGAWGSKVEDEAANIPVDEQENMPITEYDDDSSIDGDSGKASRLKSRQTNAKAPVQILLGQTSFFLKGGR